MEKKTLRTLEFDKICQKLAGFTDFTPSRDLALHLAPSGSFHTAREWLDQTTEARLRNNFV